MSNEFACLFRHDEYDTAASRAIEVIRYCSDSDVQAKRLLSIVISFRGVIQERAAPFGMGPRARSLHMDMSRGYLTDPLASLAATRAPPPLLSSGFDRQFSSAPFSSVSPNNPFIASQGNQPQAIVCTIPPVHATVNPFQGSELIRGASAASSTSGKAASVRSRTGRSVRSDAEGDAPESLSGEQEVDFDSFWNFTFGPSHMSEAPMAHAGMASVPEDLKSTDNIAGFEPGSHEMFIASDTTAVVSSPSQIPFSNANFPFYSLSYPSR